MIMRRKRVGEYIGVLAMITEDPRETTARWVRSMTAEKTPHGPW